MLSDSLNKSPQNSLFNIIDQLDHKQPLITLGNALDWQQLEHKFSLSTVIKGVRLSLLD